MSLRGRSIECVIGSVPDKRVDAPFAMRAYLAKTTACVRKHRHSHEGGERGGGEIEISSVGSRPVAVSLLPSRCACAHAAGGGRRTINWHVMTRASGMYRSIEPCFIKLLTTIHENDT